MIQQGQIIEGKYVITEKLGEGGMGQVWIAIHQEINKKVAIKFLDPELIKQQEAVTRFKVEAKAAASINNRHVIDIYDFGVTPEGYFFIVMEYLQGLELAEFIKSKKRLNIKETIDIMLQVCSALEAAHKKGIIHRDLKPENIFLVEDESGEYEVKLLDFGIAKITDPQMGAGKRLTQTGAVIGTPSYLSPEQTAGTNVIDHRVDIYAIGVIMYECLSGELPFNGDKLTEIIINIFRGEYIPLRQLRPDLPVELDEIVAKCMSYKPENRYSHALELRDALKKFRDNIHTFPVENTNIEKVEPLTKNIKIQSQNSLSPANQLIADKKRNTKMITGISIGVVLVIGIIITYFVFNKNDSGHSTSSVNHQKEQINPVDKNVTKFPDPVKVIEPPHESIKNSTIYIGQLPSGAEVFYDTKLFKELPLKVSRDTAEHLLQIKADGYKTQELKIIPNQDIITIEASLTKVNEEAVNRRTDNVKHKRRDNVQEQRNDNGLNIRKIKLNESKGIKIKRIQIGND